MCIILCMFAGLNFITASLIRKDRHVKEQVNTTLLQPFGLLTFQGRSRTDGAFLFLKTCQRLSSHISCAVSACNQAIRLTEVSNKSVPVQVPCVIWLTDWPGLHRLKDDIKQYDLLCGCSRYYECTLESRSRGRRSSR